MTQGSVRVDRASPRLLWLTGLLGLVMLAVLLALGTWQVERLAWKEALLASIDQRRAENAVPLAEMEARYRMRGDVDYMPVTATGRFHHAGERHFLATWQGKSGFYVYAPLELADGRIVMVNRGFVPYDHVVGRAILITWPIDRWSWLDNHSIVFSGVDAGTTPED